MSRPRHKRRVPMPWEADAELGADSAELGNLPPEHEGLAMADLVVLPRASRDRTHEIKDRMTAAGVAVGIKAQYPPAKRTW